MLCSYCAVSIYGSLEGLDREVATGFDDGSCSECGLPFQEFDWIYSEPNRGVRLG